LDSYGDDELGAPIAIKAIGGIGILLLANDIYASAWYNGKMEVIINIWKALFNVLAVKNVFEQEQILLVADVAQDWIYKFASTSGRLLNKDTAHLLGLVLAFVAYQGVHCQALDPYGVIRGNLLPVALKAFRVHRESLEDDEDLTDRVVSFFSYYLSACKPTSYSEHKEILTAMLSIW
jgi:hypothetical protein